MRTIAYYEVGTMRACVGCGVLFPRAARPVSRCEPCQKAKKKEWDERAKARHKADREGQDRPQRARRGACHYSQDFFMPVSTKITFLPACAICRRYPATLVNGVLDCGGQHD